MQVLSRTRHPLYKMIAHWSLTVQAAFGRWRKRHHFGTHLVPGSSLSPLFCAVRIPEQKTRLGGDLVSRAKHGYSPGVGGMRLTEELLQLPLWETWSC